MLTITLLVLLGCTGTQDTDSTSTGDADTDNDTDADIEAPFTVDLPEGITGTVTVYPGYENGYREGTDATGTCPADAVTCTVTATTEGIYWITVDSDNALFQDLSLNVNENGADPDTVSWIDGGCADEGWTPDQHIVCNDWVTGEWAMNPSGALYKNEDGETTTVTVADLTGDGKADLVITFDSWDFWPTMTMAGDMFYGNGDYLCSGTISEDMQTIQVYADLGANNDDDTFQAQ